MPAEGFAPGARSNVGGTVKRVLVHFSYFAQNDAKKDLRKLATKIAELGRRYRGRRLAAFARPRRLRHKLRSRFKAWHLFFSEFRGNAPVVRLLDQPGAQSVLSRVYSWR